MCFRGNKFKGSTVVGDKIKFPLCTDSPPTCEQSCQQKSPKSQQKSPKSRPKVASDFRHTLNVIKKVTNLFLSGEKIVCTRIQFRPKSRACANGTRRSCNFAYRSLLHSLSPFDCRLPLSALSTSLSVIVFTRYLERQRPTSISADSLD